MNTPLRERLPDTREGINRKFIVGSQKGYLRVFQFPDGRPAELFVNLNHSEQAGLWGTIGILTSLCLQYGVPIDVLASKLSGAQFPPRGPTNDREIPFASSVTDYVFRWLGKQYAPKTEAQTQTD